MGLFEKLFPKFAQKLQADGFFRTLTAYQTVFTTWSGEIYESELVRSAIHARATHISKLDVAVQGAAAPHLRAMLRTRPNDLQTWPQFLYRLSTILDVNSTAFIIPTLDADGMPDGIFTALPSSCEIVEYRGRPYLRFRFSGGQTGAMELEKCGVLTKYQYRDDIFGTDNRAALTPTMKVIDLQNQSIEESIRSSGAYRFFGNVSNFTQPDDLGKEQERFAKSNFAAGGPVLLFPNTYHNMQQVKSQTFVVDADQMNYIRQNVFNYFGVNDAVLQNKAYGADLDAFFNGAIEPFAIQLSDVLTKMFFTRREQAYGARVLVTQNRLQYMATADKISMATQLGDRGMILIDEIRALFNFPPLPDGQGQRAPIRGEYYFTDEEKSRTQALATGADAPDPGEDPEPKGTQKEEGNDADQNE